MTALWLDLHPEVSSEPFAKSDGQAWFATAALLHLAFPFLFSASSVTLVFSFVPSRSLVAFTFPTPLAVMTHCSCHCHDNRLAAHMACVVFAVGFLRYTPCVWVLDTSIWRTHSCCHSFCSHSAAVWSCPSVIERIFKNLVDLHADYRENKNSDPLNLFSITVWTALRVAGVGTEGKPSCHWVKAP